MTKAQKDLLTTLVRKERIKLINVKRVASIKIGTILDYEIDLCNKTLDVLKMGK